MHRQLQAGLLLGVFVAALMLVLSTGLVTAGPSLQAGPTATPTIPPIDEQASLSSFEALAAAVDAENLEWENASLWEGGTLGLEDVAQYTLVYAVGEQMPDFSVPAEDGAVAFALEDAEGPLLLNFWASWCGPCRLEMPLLLAAHEDPNRPFDLVMVNVWDDGPSFEVYAQTEIPEDMISARADGDALPDMFGIQAIPVTVLLDADHVIQMIHIGNVTPAVMDMLYALAGGEAPEQAVVEDQPGLPPGEATLEQLAEAADQANHRVGASTLWREGTLGVEDGFRLAVQVGEKLPSMGLMTLDGEPFRLDLAGEPYMLNFWASWCGPCVEEFPRLIARQQIESTPYQIAFVNVWDDPFTAVDFLNDYPDDLFVVVDTEGRFADAYSIEFIPTTILVDAQGIVQMIQLGTISDEVLDFAGALTAAE